MAGGSDATTEFFDGLAQRGHEPLLTRYVPPRGARRGSVRLVLRPALV